MPVDTTKTLFDFVQHAYAKTDQRRALATPHWIENLKSDRTAAKTAHICLQASVISMLCRAQNSPRYLELGAGMTAADFANNCAALRSLAGYDTAHDPLFAVFTQLQEYLRYTGGLPAVQHLPHTASDLDPLHHFATEASGRNAAAVTPSEVTRFMTAVAGAKLCDAYAMDGLGLLYGVADDVTVHLVGDELRTGVDFQLPPPLQDALATHAGWFQLATFANRAYVDLENLVHYNNGVADVLLINAARLDLPFFPRVSNEEEDLKESAGSLNHCLQAGYRRVVVLVSNHFMTAGRGRARKILEHCLHHGLRQVIQLPMGVVGLRSQAHSILVFDRGPNTEELEFIDLSAERNTLSPPKGLGWPRRARQLGPVNPDQEIARQKVKVQTLLDGGQQNSKTRKIISFEAGQFSKQDPLKQLRDTFDFMRIHEFMEVFRSHHIVETGEDDRAQYFEIGANDISEEGWIKLGKRNDCPKSSLERRKAQILQNEDLILCFRGSPESYGKVGMFRLNQGNTAIPNQSFVILRRKSEAPSHAPTANQVLWWLKSKYAQKYLKQKAISPDVMRIAPRDIAVLEVPWGPSELMEREAAKIAQAEDASRTIQNLQTQIAHLQSLAWNGKAEFE